MPLDRHHVTIASRIMMPTYPLFATGVGLSFVLTPLDRLRATPTLQEIDDLLGLRLVGAGFLLVAAALVVALLVHHRTGYLLTLAVMCGWMVAYSAGTFVSAVTGEASWSAWTWPATIAVACFASMSSLIARET